jgi:hypothetical protein
MEGNRGDGGTGITTAAELEEKHASGWEARGRRNITSDKIPFTDKYVNIFLRIIKSG